MYFEWLLKKDLQVSLWVRNLQLALFTVPISIATVYCNDGDAVRAHGLLGGFDVLVWSVVLTQAFGGIIVAMCMKYADNIMKNFASSGAIVLGGAASVFFFHFQITPQFALGAGIVLASMLIYDPNFCDCRAPATDLELMPRAKAHPGSPRSIADDDSESGLLNENRSLNPSRAGA